MRSVILGIFTALILLIGGSLTSLAASAGTSTIKVGFYSGPNTARQLDSQHVHIPDGYTAYQVTTKPTEVNTRKGLIKRLPQTGDLVDLFWQLLGVLFLLLLVLLGWLVRKNKRSEDVNER